MSEEMKLLTQELCVIRDRHSRAAYDENQGTEEWALQSALERSVQSIIDLIRDKYTRAPRPAEGAIDEGAMEITDEILQRARHAHRMVMTYDQTEARFDNAMRAALSAAAIGTGGQWVSVKEREPDRGTPVLCHWAPGSIGTAVCIWHEGQWCNPDSLEHSYSAPKFWRLLPSPPSQRGGDADPSDMMTPEALAAWKKAGEPRPL